MDGLGRRYGPVVVEISAVGNMEMKPLAIVVAIAASSCFMNPYGYQTNLMVRHLGDYWRSSYLSFRRAASLFQFRNFDVAMVLEPVNTYLRLEEMCFSLLKEYRLILLPFGPKLFALLCMLVSLAHYPKISVWRVSSGQREPPSEREGDGPPVCIRAIFQKEKLCPNQTDKRTFVD